MARICIIGNGISGITAARHLRKKTNHEILVISEESEYFYSRTALMYVYMGHMQWKDLMPYPPDFWTKNRIELLKTRVKTVNFGAKKIHTTEGQALDYEHLIIATGSVPTKYNWPGMELNGVFSLYHRWDLDAIEQWSKNMQEAVIVGGGLIGIELAEMLNSRKIKVTMLVRESEYGSYVLPNEEAKMVSMHIRNHGIDLRLGTQLEQICGKDQVGSVISDQREEIPCQMLGICIGVRPNIDVFQESGLECDLGVLVDDQLRTNFQDVYAIGDCAQLRHPQPGRRAIEPLWYTGRMMGKTAAANIAGEHSSYLPGIWFNSAKFFDIEYQVYGQILPKTPENIQSIYWRHPTKEKSIRINYERESLVVTGFNLMGCRFRQEVCELWLQEKTIITQVLQNIRLAFFDPEFYEDVAVEFLKSATNQTGIELQAQANWKLNEVIRFLEKTTKS
ncbi:MAG: FAD-dependent oxidoreductase [Saprospiraceae bacterium]|nr:FAD-dependent oxidoreductase [Saprospiraceae bacterium]